ncbi:MAG TPA: methyltransferase domain-containing protein [Bacteroidia bacterium]|nr:methyltransferase domain-containing protein [Bacteroidia bacterium]MBP7714511.1 methyltransferase domain-containing protein [Bacteroidia bacterium]MBP8668910.1 methyltransferase domain-containing protein [Bacteroidia bacterium]HOZ81857.1 methyltransferase domain-containing protein [Bacteroidia bacterium]HOZ90206.1 methyltransferase domain-containing protein [Bacteroidia bacterium]
MSDRISNELEHGKKLLEGGAEAIWNWDSPAGKVRADRRADLIAKYSLADKSSTVLEIGCGTGLFSGKFYQRTGAKIIATDLSPELLNVAKEKYPAVEFVLADAMKLQFDANTFDVVFGSSVLHHLEFERSLNEILRVLKPGGRMVFAEPNMINPQIFVQKNIPFIKKWLGDSPDETAINRWNFSKLLEQKGFNQINIFPYDFLHPVVPSFLISLVSGIGQVVEKIPIAKEIAGSVIIVAEKPR